MQYLEVMSFSIMNNGSLLFFLLRITQEIYFTSYTLLKKRIVRNTDEEQEMRCLPENF